MVDTESSSSLEIDIWHVHSLEEHAQHRLSLLYQLLGTRQPPGDVENDFAHALSGAVVEVVLVAFQHLDQQHNNLLNE